MVVLGATMLILASSASEANAQACSSLTVQTDRGSYVVGDSVEITINFTPLLPGCVGVMIAHDYVVKTQILNDANQTVSAWSNETVGPLTVHKIWTPVVKGNYTIQASAWFRLSGDEAMTQQLQTATTIHVQDAATSSMSELTSAGFVAALILGATFLLLAAKHVTRRKDRKEINQPMH